MRTRSLAKTIIKFIFIYCFSLFFIFIVGMKTLADPYGDFTKQRSVTGGPETPEHVKDPDFIISMEGPLEASHPQLLEVLRQRYLEPPSTKSYNLMMDQVSRKAAKYNAYRNGFISYVRCQNILQRFFNNSPPGFFIEAGAMDGEFISNTLYLEKTHGWTGLLIEPDWKTYRHLLKKNRNAWSTNTCISTRNYATEVPFVSYSSADSDILNDMLARSTSNVDGIAPPAAGLMGVKEDPRYVNCFPLYSYILALNKSKVDFVSLDVEGAESEILLTFPWEDVDITAFSIEHRMMNHDFEDYLVRKSKIYSLSNLTSSLFDNHHHKPDNSVTGRNYNTTDNEEKVTIESNSTVERVIKHVKKIVYTDVRDPTKGKDEYFITYMGEKGYQIVDYWDGDYTFVKRNTTLWQKIMNGEI